MSAVYSHFLSLLAAFLQKKSPPLLPDANWEEIAYLARIHSVTGIVGYMALQLPEESRPNNADSLATSYYATVTHSAQREYAMHELMAAYEQEQIPLVLMKGFVLKDFYPVKELRTFGDIDFLIKKEDRQRSHVLMQALGFQTKKNKGEVWDYKKDGFLYEIHTHLIDGEITPNSQGSKYFSNPWKHALPISDTGYAHQFTTEFHFVYLLQHLAKHIHGHGAGIRMFMDIDVCLRSFPTLDWDYVWNELRVLELDEFSKLVFQFCAAWFGTPLPISLPEAPPDLLAQITSYVLEAGTFGFVDRNHAAPRIRATIGTEKDSEKDEFLRLRTVFRVLFPPYSTMKYGYPVLERKPFLLPLLWLLRAFKVFSPKRRRITRSLAEIKGGVSEAEQQYRLLSELHLTSFHENQGFDIHGK